MRIEHLIPEKITRKEFAKQRRLCGLPKDFKVTDYRNLVASCEPCNKVKLDRLREAKALLFVWLLEEAERKASKIEEHVRKAEQAHAVSKLKTTLRMGLKSGKLTDKIVTDTLNSVLSEVQSTLTVSATADSVSITTDSNHLATEVMISNPTVKGQWVDRPEWNRNNRKRNRHHQ